MSSIQIEASYMARQKVQYLGSGVFDTTGIPRLYVYEDDGEEQARNIINFLTHHEPPIYAITPRHIGCACIYLARKPRKVAPYSRGQELIVAD